ncbi:hypothetical protein QE152_g1693 [Popillia japonica]|uniref:Uncharacterized protein n=1 Tax=Popillia japonica TaxID=7064 RepID=A0AAW1N1T2_POPJA
MKPLSRQQFVLKLQQQLTRPWQEERLKNCPSLSRQLKDSKSKVLQFLDQPMTQNQEESQKKGKRTYLLQFMPFCEEENDDHMFCMPGEHQIKICMSCSELKK